MTRALRLWLLTAYCLLAYAQSPVRTFTILHTNDLHAHLLPDSDGLGGFAYLAAELRHQREGCTTCLYLNAGDLVQGTPVSTIYHGIPVYRISNLLGIDVATLGNHEFDYGWKSIATFLKTARYPVVTDNIVNASGQLLTGKGYVIKQLGGIRIAIVGVMLGDLVGNLSTEEQVGPWKVEPVVDAVRKTVDRIRGKADLIVVVGHIHSAEAEQIEHQVPEVSIVVIGHEHKGYTEVRRFENHYIVEAKSYGVELGRLDFQFDTEKHEVVSAQWKLIPIDSHKIAPAPDVQKLVDKWEAKVSKIVDVPIGESRRRLAGAELRRLIETGMAEESGADIAWINSGNVRDFLPQGPLLARQIWNLLPFDNYILVGTFRGSELPAKVKQEFPDLHPDRTYKLATTDFTVANQASTDQLGVSGLKFPVKAQLQRDAIIDWIRKKKVIE
jgi:2',3'-cyclic-nucleotide 2'-phosphodiesterase (5'-nucleotidase family)